MEGSACQLEELRLEVVDELRRAIGFDRFCVLLADPDTLMEHQGLGANDWRSEVPTLNLNTGRQADVNSLAVLVRRRDPVGALRAATGGDPARSERWREVYSRYGVRDELRTAAVDRHGCWGEVFMYRSSDDKPFDTDDVQLMSAASSLIARTLRAGQVAPMRAGDPAPTEVGVLLLDDHLCPSGFTTSARAWCEALNPNRVRLTDGIPSAIWNVVGRLLGAEHGVRPHLPPRVRMRAGDGSWAVVEAARLHGEGTGVAVTMRPAASIEVLGLVSRAHALSPRECQVLALLLAGSRRDETAERLSISRHTVEDHVKSILGKVGVRSRRELVTGVFGQSAYDAGASSSPLRTGSNPKQSPGRSPAAVATARAERTQRGELGDRHDGTRRRLPTEREVFLRHLAGLMEAPGRSSTEAGLRPSATSWTDDDEG